MSILYSITLAQVEAAKQMLKDFCILLLNCMAKAVVLLILTCFLTCLNMSVYGGRFGLTRLLVLKAKMVHLFHGNSDIVHQLLFNIDVMYTVEQVRTKLVEFDSQQTVSYIEQLNHLAPRSNMTPIGTGRHTYIVGKCKLTRECLQLLAMLVHLKWKFLGECLKAELCITQIVIQV